MGFDAQGSHLAHSSHQAAGTETPVPADTNTFIPAGRHTPEEAYLGHVVQVPRVSQFVVTLLWENNFWMIFLQALFS